MTKFKGFAVLSAAALIAAPVAAQAAPAAASAANPAASLSVARAASPSAGKSHLGASVPGTTLISIGILAALVVGVLVATGGDNSDSN